MEKLIIKNQLYWKFSQYLPGEYGEFNQIRISFSQLHLSLLLSQRIISLDFNLENESNQTPSQVQVSIEAKTCIRCKVLKPIAEFRTRKDRPNQSNSYCKDCEKKYQEEYRDRFRKRLVRRDIDKLIDSLELK